MSRATDQEKTSVRDLCILKEKYNEEHKRILSRRRPFLEAIKDSKKEIERLLTSDQHYAALPDNLYARKERQANMGKIKPSEVERVLRSLTRGDVLSGTPSTTNVWDAVCEVFTSKLNESRRSYTTRFSISKSRPRNGVEMAATPAIRSAYERMQAAQGQLTALKGGDSQRREKELKGKVDEVERTVLSYMQRTNRKKQKVNIGVADNVQQKFVICMKQRRKKPPIKMPELVQALRSRVSGFSSLDQFFDSMDEVIKDVLSSVDTEVAGGDYLTLLSTGVKSSRSRS